MQEIGGSEKEEMQGDSKGCSRNSHRCKGYVESRGTRRGYVQRSHTLLERARTAYATPR